MKNAKYTNKMEDMILARYKNNTNNQLKTAKKILKDFKTIFSSEAIVGMTPAKIRSKYQCLKREQTRPPEAFTAYANKKEASLRDQIFAVMRKSDDMTITVKGTEITVVFK